MHKVFTIVFLSILCGVLIGLLFFFLFGYGIGNSFFAGLVGLIIAGVELRIKRNY